MAKKKRLESLSIPVVLTGTLVPKFKDEVRIFGGTPERYAQLLIDNSITVDPDVKHARRQKSLLKLVSLIGSLPAVKQGIGRSEPEDYCWWIKFSLDRKHPLVWHVIQRLGHVLNYITLEERLDVVFRPVSPPPYLNGGPEYLSWVIEATKRYVNPETVRKVLRAQLPATLSSEKQWREYDTEE
jgi:hypothetical protein